MTEYDYTTKPSAGFTTEMSFGQLLQTFIGGTIVGMATGGITWLLAMYVFKVAPCGAGACGSGGSYALIVATIFGAAIALFWLLKAQVFRPLLVVIVVTASLWGMPLLLMNWPWYGVVAAIGGVYGLAYCTVAWLARIRQFWLALLLLLLLAVAVRLVLY